MSKFMKLSRAEMKNVLGGKLPPGGSSSCSCSLTPKDGSADVSMPISSADGATESGCSSACKTYCDNSWM